MTVGCNFLCLTAEIIKVRLKHILYRRQQSLLFLRQLTVSIIGSIDLVIVHTLFFHRLGLDFFQRRKGFNQSCYSICCILVCCGLFIVSLLCTALAMLVCRAIFLTGAVLFLTFFTDVSAVTAGCRHIAAVISGAHMGAFHPDAAGLLAADMTAAPFFIRCLPESAVPMGMTAILLHGRLRYTALCMNHIRNTAAVRAFRQHRCTVFPVNGLRIADTNNLVLGCNIVAVAMDMVAVCRFHSRSIDTPLHLMVVDTFHNLFGQTGLTAHHMATGRPIHLFHVPTLVVMEMVGARRFLCQSRHRQVRHYHAQSQQQRQNLFRIFHQYFLLHRSNKDVQTAALCCIYFV